LYEAVKLLNEDVVTNELVSREVPEPVSTVRGNVLPSPLVNVIVFELIEAVTSKLPVSVGVPPEPVSTVSVNEEPSP
jgi:hypothetical protein